MVHYFDLFIGRDRVLVSIHFSRVAADFIPHTLQCSIVASQVTVRPAVQKTNGIHQLDDCKLTIGVNE